MARPSSWRRSPTTSWRRPSSAPGQAPEPAAAVGRDIKGRISPILYLVAIPIALVAPALSVAIHAAVAVIWIVPDRHMERALSR